jgi:pimeloyl-ACP methyl ester carboxylesterase
MTGDLKIIQRSVEANGITFACDECGFGDDVALLLHGFPECRISWRHQLVPLARLGWRVIAPDLRGYGDTTRPRDRDAYRLRHLVDDVAALFSALGARRKLLIGHDWGALIAWSVAIERAVPLTRSLSSMCRTRRCFAGSSAIPGASACAPGTSCSFSCRFYLRAR